VQVIAVPLALGCAHHAIFGRGVKLDQEHRSKARDHLGAAARCSAFRAFDVDFCGTWWMQSMKCFDRIEQQKVEPDLPEGIMALELLQMAYRGKVKLTPQQTRCATTPLLNSSVEPLPASELKKPMTRFRRF
jgi:hypothetical protein